MRTRMNEDFGIRYPLCSAGMAMIATPELAAAVSEAGGLGVLGCGPAPAEWLRGAIREVKARTSKPFGVNLIHETTSFGPMTTDAHVAVCIEENVDLVVFFWQVPERAWADSLRAAGIRFWVTAGDEDTVMRATTLPVSGLILQGTEAGGHVKSGMRLAELLKQTRRARPDLTLVGAGGIGCADDVRRVLGLGADGVCLGTRFVACTEANAHPEYQRRIVAARATDTVITQLFGPEWPNVPMRVIANHATSGTASSSPIGRTVLFGQPYELPPCSAILPTRETTGDFGLMCLAAGESVETIRSVQTAGQIVRELFDAWWD